MACTHYMGICDHLVCDKALAQVDVELELFNESAEPRLQAAMAYSDRQLTFVSGPDDSRLTP